jgi:hypothetical protein
MSDQNKKYLYSFEVKDDSGANRKFAILKPNRKVKEEGELYYASKLSQFISAGILPKILWDKMFKDSGGIVARSDRKEYSDLFEELSTNRNAIDKISVKPESSRTTEEKAELEKLQATNVLIRKEMQDLEFLQINAFENTAEAKARNKTIVWWAANLAVEESSSGKTEYLLGSGDIEEKLDNYDNFVENNEFLTSVFSRVNYLVTVWYLGSAETFEDFKNLDDEFARRNFTENNSDESVESVESVEESKGVKNEAVEQTVEKVETAAS